MKPEDIMDAMNNIDDEIISEAQKIRTKKKKRKTWVKWVAVAACFCLIVGGIFGHFRFNRPQTAPSENPSGTTSVNSLPAPLNSFGISAPTYPQMLKYPNEKDYLTSDGEVDWNAYSEAMTEWRNDVKKRENNFVSASDYSRFFNTTTKKFFSDTKGENLVYSPVNVYMALSMLAESTDGASRQQILDLLGASSVEELRTLANKLWLSNYSDNGVKTNILANSVWMNDSLSYNKSTLDILAEKYYASSFSGTMGSAEYSAALQNWLNEQTGGLLKEQAGGLEFTPDMVLSLASTVYFKCGWENEFSEHLTKPDVFNGTKGEETADFMFQTLNGVPYYTDSNYSATVMSFTDSGKMWLILPDEGISPEELIQNGDINSVLSGSVPANRHDGHLIHLYMPKFDVVSSMELSDYAQALGVTDVFDAVKADFSPIIESNINAYVDSINHSARVTVDEQGCTAAAFTVITAEGTMIPEGKEIDFRLNRPFIFVITSDDSTPLFVGVVNTMG